MSIQKKLIHNQRRIGLTGGIASGKSTITNYIKKYKKLTILDADIYSRDLIQPNSKGYKQVIEYFGDHIVDPNCSENQINKSKLKSIIFKNNDHRLWIQRLLHPLIKERMIEKCNQLKDKKTLLLVIPLLFEAKFDDICTEIWLVKCPQKTQRERLMKRDNISENEAKKIINLQLGFKEKMILSDTILDNSNDKKLWINEIEKLI